MKEFKLTWTTNRGKTRYINFKAKFWQILKYLFIIIFLVIVLSSVFVYSIEKGLDNQINYDRRLMIEHNAERAWEL